MKFALPLVLGLAFVTSACNTIENRRSVYTRKKADGPYTRSLQDGSWEKQRTVDEEYEEAKRHRARQPSPAAAAAEDSVAPTNNL